MPDPSYWLIRVTGALPGAAAGWRSYQAYRNRRRDPSAPRNAAADFWWRTLFIAGPIAIASIVAVFLAPTSALNPLFVVLAASIGVCFIAAFAIGWTSA